MRRFWSAVYSCHCFWQLVIGAQAEELSLSTAYRPCLGTSGLYGDKTQLSNCKAQGCRQLLLEPPTVLAPSADARYILLHCAPSPAIVLLAPAAPSNHSVNSCMAAADRDTPRREQQRQGQQQHITHSRCLHQRDVVALQQDATCTAGRGRLRNCASTAAGHSTAVHAGSVLRKVHRGGAPHSPASVWSGAASQPTLRFCQQQQHGYA